MEVVRDRADNCIIVCAIENLDPMGIHTGDSITVAPAQTLSDKEYQLMRNASIAILREIGVDTGGSNVQFAINPEDGRMVVIEMNPRVCALSALASKATGFPIAKVAAKLAVGYTLDELRNDITGGATPASFEPSIDYVVTKIPRFAFEKFPAADPHLTTQMKSVGEVMAIGRTFQESFQKALRGLETGIDGLSERSTDRDEIIEEIGEAGPERILFVADAFRIGMSLDEIFEETAIDPWFLAQIQQIVPTEQALAGRTLESLSAAELRFLKQKGFSDAAWPGCWAPTSTRCAGAATRWACARSTSASTPAPPSSPRRPPTCTRPTTRSARPSRPTRKKIMVLGGGPNRIGQGIEFDYCCVHAALAMREDGYETIMVNCNPETVSTDYDTSRPPVLRAGDAGRRARDRRGGKAARRDRAVRRPDAAEARARPRARRRADHRHQPGQHRPRRGPRALPAAAAQARPPAAAEPHRAHRRGGAGRWRSRSATRWWCGPATCSAAARWRSCTATRTCERYMREAVQRAREVAGAARSLPRRRDRGRCRLHHRRQRRR